MNWMANSQRNGWVESGLRAVGQRTPRRRFSFSPRTLLDAPRCPSYIKSHFIHILQQTTAQANANIFKLTLDVATRLCRELCRWERSDRLTRKRWAPLCRATAPRASERTSSSRPRPASTSRRFWWSGALLYILFFFATNEQKCLKFHIFIASSIY